MKTITLDEIDKYISESQKDESSFLRPASDFCDQVISFFHDRKEREINRMPWAKCEGKFNLRPYEVTCWLGFNGHGKSLILGQIANHLMQLGEKVCIASLEMRPHATMARMCRQAFGVPVPSMDVIRGYHRWTDDRLWIYDQNGSVPPIRIINLGKYAASIGIKHLVVDSLMKVVSREDDYNGQKEFVDSLCVLARDTGLHVHLVHHSRKGQDESKVPGKMDAKGTGAISDLVDNCCTVWRPKDKNDTTAGKYDCLVKVDKQRHGEWEGPFGLFFSPDAQGYYEDELLKYRRMVIPNAEIHEESF